MLRRLVVGSAAALAVGCGGASITLHAPTCAQSAAREEPATVDFEPLATRDGAAADTTVPLSHPAPAEVMTSGIQSELGARALTGGDAGGYRAKCTLDRFALRVYPGVVATQSLATLYVDLGCTVERRADGVAVWRGALRGRAMATATTPLTSGVALVQRLADRAMSDASREIASDLAVRVLGLGGTPSARVFADEAARTGGAGVDDTPFGPVALAEAPDRIPLVLPSLRDLDPQVRAATWNAIAMAAGPRDRWYAGEMTLDDEPSVRFYQYKALARNGSYASLRRLGEAETREDEAWLVELVKDLRSTGGLALARRGR